MLNRFLVASLSWPLFFLKLPLFYRSLSSFVLIPHFCASFPFILSPLFLIFSFIFVPSFLPSFPFFPLLCLPSLLSLSPLLSFSNLFIHPFIFSSRFSPRTFLLDILPLFFNHSSFLPAFLQLLASPVLPSRNCKCFHDS